MPYILRAHVITITYCLHGHLTRDLEIYEKLCVFFFFSLWWYDWTVDRWSTESTDLHADSDEQEVENVTLINLLQAYFGRSLSQSWWKADQTWPFVMETRHFGWSEGKQDPEDWLLLGSPLAHSMEEKKIAISTWCLQRLWQTAACLERSIALALALTPLDQAMYTWCQGSVSSL